MNLRIGKLNGMKWIVGSGLRRVWLGLYEPDKRKKIEQEVNEGSVFYDIGAHAGYFTLLASNLTGNSGEVHAFEPLPQNLKALRKHIQINQLHNVVICNEAISDKRGTMRFDFTGDSYTGKLSDEGSLNVETDTLDRYVFGEKHRKPDFIKIDVEGAEVQVLRGARRVLKDIKPVFFIDTHSEELKKTCITILKNKGYKVSYSRRGLELYASPIKPTK